MKVVELSGEQEGAAEVLVEWARHVAQAPRGKAGAQGPGDDRVRALRGLAGTGKTTVAAEVVRRLVAGGTRVAVVAPTGKAAHVLRTKGVHATTVHAAAYELLGEDADGGPEFKLRAEVAGDPDVVVCDEASMATREHLDDLLEHVPRVLLVGDPGQLPPVSGQPVLADALGVDLETVHRQAMDSGVVRFAHAIRRGASIADALKAGAPDVVAGKPSHLVGVVLTARNDQRVRLNDGIRKQLHAAACNAPPTWPVVGDRVVCLSNHSLRYASPAARVAGLWCNGTVGDVVRVGHALSSALPDSMREFTALCDDGVERTARAWLRQLSSPTLLQVEEHDRFRREARFAWGWCLTTHKAQGSEWDEVAVMGDGFGTPDEIRAWRYTAATRAARRVWWSA